ncbi:MAG: thioesterase domain-containing protein [Candidatus Sulfotelmatobacter sp.]|jgi:thioesterase domain-containing protein
MPPTVSDHKIKSIANLSVKRLQQLARELKTSPATSPEAAAEHRAEPTPLENKETYNLVAIKSGGKRLPLFLMHPSGGSVITYYTLAAALDGEQPVFAIEYDPQVEGKSGIYLSMEQRATRYVELVRTARPDGPYLLGGWSMGGVLAFEMARQLTAADQEVICVILLDSGARLHPALSSDLFAASELIMIGKDLALNLGKELRVTTDDLERLPPQERNRSFAQALKSEDVMPRYMSIEYFLDLLKGLKSTERSMREYRPGPYDGQVLLLRTLGKKDLMRSIIASYDQPALGWEDVCSKIVEVHHVPGDHNSMLKGENAKLIGSILEKHLLLRASA